MKANRRMYSLPYNGTNPEWFLQEAEKRKNNIDHVYCELPLTESDMFSHVRFLFDGKKNTGSKQNAKPDPEKTNLKRANYVKNCAEFLRISKSKVRRICPVNAMYYRYDTEEELKDFVISLERLRHLFGPGGQLLPAGGFYSFGLPYGRFAACPVAGTGDPYILQRLPVEQAADGNLAGKVRRHGFQPATGNPAYASQIKRNARGGLQIKVSD